MAWGMGMKWAPTKQGDKMNKIEGYMRDWGLSEPRTLAHTKTSNLYTVVYKGSCAVLKVYTEFGMAFEHKSPAALRYFGGAGTIKVLKHDYGAILIEFVDGHDLYNVFKHLGDAHATCIACEVLRKLHSSSVVCSDQFETLEDRFQSLFKRASSQDEHPLFYDCQSVARRLIESECDKKILHGDIHHHNIMLSSTRGWLAIDPYPLYAEKTYDLCNFFFNPIEDHAQIATTERIGRVASTFADELGADKQRILEFAFAHGGLSASWHIDDGEDPSDRLNITQLLKGMI